MTLIGRGVLRAVPDPEPSETDQPIGGGLDGGTGPERQAVIDYLLGLAVDQMVADTCERYGGRGTDTQRARLYREAHQQLMDKATTPEHLDAGVDRARAIGRGETP